MVLHHRMEARVTRMIPACRGLGLALDRTQTTSLSRSTGSARFLGVRQKNGQRVPVPILYELQGFTPATSGGRPGSFSYWFLELAAAATPRRARLVP